MLLPKQSESEPMYKRQPLVSVNSTGTSHTHAHFRQSSVTHSAGTAQESDTISFPVDPRTAFKTHPPLSKGTHYSADRPETMEEIRGRDHIYIHINDASAPVSDVITGFVFEAVQVPKNT